MSRPKVERQLILENSWCDNCKLPDLGMCDPAEFEESGSVVVEGRCVRCDAHIRTTVTTRTVAEQ